LPQAHPLALYRKKPEYLDSGFFEKNIVAFIFFCQTSAAASRIG
jgi:hypothetical protein